MKRSTLTLIVLLSTHLLATDITSKELYMHAQAVYNQGDFKQAYPLFEQLLEQTPQSAEINFFVGRCALELHQYDEAMAAFDRVLMINPKHTRTHLELARLYYERQQLELSRTELNLVLNDQLPSDIRDVAMAFKRRIDASISPHHFNGAVIVGGGYDSNVNNDIGNKAFILPSLNIPISGNTKEKDGYGFSTFVLNHSYDFGERGGWTLENSFVGYDKLYSKSSLNNLVLFSLSSAPTWSEKQVKFALPVMFDRVYIDGKGYLYNVGAGLKETYLLDPLSAIEGGYTFKRGYYHEETYDVNAHLIYANYRRIVGDNLFAFALQTSYSINKEVETTRTDVDYTEFKYGIDLSKEFTKTFRGSLGYTRINDRYSDVDTIFLTKRHDEKNQYELSLGYTVQKNLSLGASVAYSDNHSNHDPYDYDKLNALASVMWTF